MSRKAIPLLALLAAVPACSLLPSIDFQQMNEQAKAKVWQSSPFFEDDRAMRPLPEGAFPHDGIIDDAQGPVSAESVRAGRARYDIYCAACHGLTGDGDTRVALNMSLRRPPALTDAARRHLTDAHIYEVITSGYGLMRPYTEDLITPEERWSVVAYLRALQLSQSTPLDILPPIQRDDALRELP